MEMLPRVSKGNTWTLKKSVESKKDTDDVRSSVSFIYDI